MLSWYGEEEETGCSCSDDDSKDDDDGEDDDGYDNDGDFDDEDENIDDEDILIEGWMWYGHITAVFAEAIVNIVTQITITVSIYKYDHYHHHHQWWKTNYQYLHETEEN